MNVVPHVAQNEAGGRLAEPDAIAQNVGYAMFQQRRKLIEQGFGCSNIIEGICQVMVRGLKC